MSTFSENFRSFIQSFVFVCLQQTQLFFQTKQDFPPTECSLSNNVLDIEQNLNQDLENVNEWLIANKLTLNQSKPEFMLIGSRQRIRTFETSPSLEIGGMPINRVSHTKSIGVYLDDNLIWNEHINQISRKIASGIGALKRIRSFVPDTTLQFNHILITVASSGIIVVKLLLTSYKNYKIEQRGY